MSDRQNQALSVFYVPYSLRKHTGSSRTLEMLFAAVTAFTNSARFHGVGPLSSEYGTYETDRSMAGLLKTKVQNCLNASGEPRPEYSR